MTVLGQVVAQRRPYGAFDDPALPVGIWVARREVTGDATGGNVEILVVFADTSQPRTQQLFSLEQITVGVIGAGTETDVVLETVNLDPDLAGKNNANASQRWFLTMKQAAALGRSALTPESARAMAGVFLGRQQVDFTLTGVNTLFNNVNTGVHLVRAQGYVWGPRSVSIPSGPLRPIPGLYLN